MFGRAKNKGELQQMKDAYMQNLQVEIDNANVLETRKRKPDEAPPVPPQYKTEAEIQEDIMSLRKELVDTIMNEFGFGYSNASQSIEGLTNDDIIRLVATFPAFKLDLFKDANRQKMRIFKPEWLNLAFKKYLQNTSKSFGETYEIAGTPTTLEALEKMMPSADVVNQFKDFISGEYEGVDIPSQINATNPNNFRLITKYLDEYIRTYPSLSQLKDMKLGLNQVSRNQLATSLGSLINLYNMITTKDIADLQRNIMTIISKADKGEIENLGNTILGYFGGDDYDARLNQFRSQWQVALRSKGGKDIQYSTITAEDVDGDGEDDDEVVIEFAEKASMPVRPNRRQTKEERDAEMRSKGHTLIFEDGDGIQLWQSPQEVKQNISLLINELSDAGLREEATSLISEVDRYPDVIGRELALVLRDNDMDMQYIEIEPTNRITNVVQDLVTRAEQKINETADREEEDMGEVLDNMFNMNSYYRSEALKRLTTLFNRPSVSFPQIDRYLDKIKEGFLQNYAVDVEFTKWGSSERRGTGRKIDAIKEVMEEIDNLFDSGVDYNPDYKSLFPDTTEGVRKKTLFVGFGVKPKMSKGKGVKKQGQKSREDEKLAMEVKGLKASLPSVKNRISVKRLVGKGVEVAEQPRYRQFGKYVLHQPNLSNNVLNFKYPSLGSIPSIKPKTISDDYKDFIIDVLETGRVNERVFDKLDDEEKSHFHKVCKGAGLLETFKMKRGETEEERNDLDRFNLLKGSYVAGNDSEKVIRELRALISKFVQEGRITKNEGLQMLMEIQ